MKSKKVLAVSLICAATIILLIGAGCTKQTQTQTTVQTPDETQQTKNEVTLVIDDGTNNLQTFTQNYTEKMTAYDLLKKVTDTKSIALSVSSSSFGVMINKIGEKKGGEEEKYWMYYVNSKAPQVAADKYELKAGDKVEFKFEKTM
jgi:hypothetical protein